MVDAINDFKLTSMNVSCADCFSNIDIFDKYSIPIEISSKMKKEYFEYGKANNVFSFFEKYIKEKESQSIFIELFYWAVQTDNHCFLWNILQVVTMFTREEIGNSGAIIAMSATRSKFRDVREIGLMAFENWEYPGDIDFLENCKFEDEWLNSLKKEILDYLKEIAKDKDALYKKNNGWKVASERRFAGSESSDNILRSGFNISGD